MIVYAVNIHTGGGKVLLDTLIADQPFGSITKVYADARYIPPADKPSHVKVIAIKPTLLSRLYAEIRLYNDQDFTADKQVLFFGNLPPLFRPFFSVNRNKKFILYLQNAFLIVSFKYPKNTIKEGIRLSVEKLWLHIFNSNVDEIWVQTQWMKEQTQLSLGSNKEIKVAPFLPKLPKYENLAVRRYKFLYVGSLAKHKALDVFLTALQSLDNGLTKKISVCVVLDSATNDIEVLNQLKLKNIEIDLFTSANREDLFKIYQNSQYLVCTSRIESYYLPIYEAHHFGCTIVLPESVGYSSNLPADIKTKMYPAANLDLSLF